MKDMAPQVVTWGELIFFVTGIITAIGLVVGIVFYVRLAFRRGRDRFLG